MIGVLLITHGPWGTHCVDALTGMLGQLPLPTETLALHRDDDPDMHADRVMAALTRLDHGDGVLMLTDAYGSTPSNIAARAHMRTPTTASHIITGMNLPMLIRLYNYPQLGLDEAARSALEAGRNGIMQYDHSST